MENIYQNHVRVFKSLCDENRLRILELLTSGEWCAFQLLQQLQIGQSTLSHHMKILCNSGIVRNRRAGKLTYYGIDLQGVDRAKALLEEITKLQP